MTRIQFGFCMPADRLDTARQPTFVDDLNRALDLVSGHFDSAWFINHLQSGDAGLLEGFTALTYMAALHPQLTFGHTVLCHLTTLTLWELHSRWSRRCARSLTWASIILLSTAGGSPS
jgi:hypothetical protein